LKRTTSEAKPELPPLYRVGEGAVEDYDDATPEVFIPSPLEGLNEMILGAVSAELVIVAGKPGDGKTAFVMQWLLETAQNGNPSAIMSLEMGRRTLRNRLVSGVTGIPMRTLRTKEWPSEKHKQAAKEAGAWLNELPLFVDDRSGLAPDAVYSTIVSWKQRGVTLGVVDYVQNIGGENDSRVVQVGDAVKAVKNAAKDADLPIIAVSSLNRSNTDNRAPRLSDLRDSGELEFVGDTIIMFHYPDGPDDKDQPTRQVDMHVLKNKNGPCGIASALFKQAGTTFSEVK
jgi:replicative DNA helicase